MSFEYETNINKVLKKVQNKLEQRSVQHARRIGEKLNQAVASFNDVYLVPVYSKSTVELSLSGDDLDKQLEEDTLLSQLLTEQEQAINDELATVTEIILKEALKG